MLPTGMMSTLGRFGLLFPSVRLLGTKAKFDIRLDAATATQLRHSTLKHRRHPGIERLLPSAGDGDSGDGNNATASTVRIPSGRIAAIRRVLGEHPAKQVWSDSLHLQRYLRARHPPAEPADTELRRAECERELLDAALEPHVVGGGGTRSMSVADRKLFEQRVQKLVAQRTYCWRPIEYDAYRSLQYLLGRAAPEYAALRRVFGELARRRPTFAPHSFFDFGSGVGTGTWAAADQWRQSIFEYYLVDASRDMNDLADLLLRDGDENRPLELRNVNFRQFLPASTETKYDIVLSAFSLLELPDAKTRLETVRTLWNKCDRFLVLIEQGTRAGFNMINEARDFVLYSSNQASDKMERECDVFAPCPHSESCPRKTAADDRTPCNFLVAYTQLPLVGGGAAAAAEVRHEPFSYVVLERRNAAATDRTDAEWPRLVRPTLVRSKHTICRMCTAAGRLEEVIFTQRQHGKDVYRCARVSRWGDRLPVKVELDKSERRETTAERYKNKTSGDGE